DGKVAEKRKEVDRAVAAYKEALRRGASGLALNPLVALLVREGRDADLKKVREEFSIGASEFDLFTAVEARRGRDKARAEQLADLAVKGDPDGLDVRLWQAGVLRGLGKPDAADAALAELTRLRPSEPAPWLALLMLRVERHKAAEAAATVEQIRAAVQTPTKELLVAQCYRAVGDFRRADEYYRESLRKWPNEPAVLSAVV